MSYLVDALRKAELERRQGAEPEVAALSGRMPNSRAAGPGLIGWIVAILVVCNLLLFGYLLWPQAEKGSAVSARAQVAQTQSTDKPGKIVALSNNQPTASALPVSTKPEYQAPMAQDAVHERTATTGRVIASTTHAPKNDRRYATRQPAKPSPSEVPDVDIHGHLYSAQHSESFILVDGHLYHEGEQLPSGAVVVRIERNGALLNYRGRRFHVNAPG